MVEILNCPICDNQHLKVTTQSKDFTVTSEVFNIIACDRCELLITSPRPSNNELGKYYRSDNYISHTSKAKNLTDRLYLIARKFTLANKVSLISRFSSKGSLLDYGCGTGDFLTYARRKQWEAYGVEPADNARKSSDPRIVKSISEIDKKNFNVITLWHVLEHIPDVNDILQKLRDKLGKDGTIFIAVPNYKSFDAKYYKETWAGYDAPRHLWHFSQKSMARLLEKNSLKLITTKPMILDSIYVSQLSEKYLFHNKPSIKGFINGSIIGLRSNLAALTSKEYSSLIYVAKK